MNLGWYEVIGHYLFFYPKNNVVACPSIIITEVMVEANFCHIACF